MATVTMPAVTMPPVTMSPAPPDTMEGSVSPPPSDQDQSLLQTLLQYHPRLAVCHRLGCGSRLGCGRTVFACLALCIARICPTAREKRVHLLAYLTGLIFGAFLYVCWYSMSFALNYKGNIYAVLDAKTDADAVRLIREGGRGEEVFKIPRILHQSWKTEHIPEEFLPWMGSWQKHHPDWSHNFWTQTGVDQMIERVFPSFYSQVYHNYTTALHRYLVTRYFILHHQGGVYVDLDMESTQRLDPLMKTHSCILTEQPLAHRAVLYNSSSPNYIVNSFMACRKGHPFLTFLLEMLETYLTYDVKLEPSRERVDKSVGSLFLGDVYQLYKAAYNNTGGPEPVHILPSELLLPNYNERYRSVIVTRCMSEIPLQPAGRQVCRALQKSDFSNKLPPGAFCKCNWVDLYDPAVNTRLSDSRTLEVGKIDIKSYARQR